MLEVIVESTSVKAVASVKEWPGWTRIARSEDLAVASLDGYRDRYRAFLQRGGIEPFDDEPLEVVERYEGNGTTSFGVPAIIAPSDLIEPGRELRERYLHLMNAAWSALDEAVASAPEILPKGPKGGGRDRDGIRDHVLSAEASYVRKFGILLPLPKGYDPFLWEQRKSEVRQRVLEDSANESPWPVTYFFRRSIWHVLDHVWELEDKGIGEASSTAR